MPSNSKRSKDLCLKAGAIICPRLSPICQNHSPSPPLRLAPSPSPPRCPLTAPVSGDTTSCKVTGVVLHGVGSDFTRGCIPRPCCLRRVCIRAHQFGSPGPVFAPKLSFLYRENSMSTYEWSRNPTEAGPESIWQSSFASGRACALVMRILVRVEVRVCFYLT